MRKTELISACFLIFGMTAAANAAVINLSLDSNDWEKTPYLTAMGFQTPDAIVMNTFGGLRGIKTTATGGTNWSLGLHTLGSYDFQGATLRYKWLLNGLGNWSGIYNGVDTDAGHLIARPFVTSIGSGFTDIPSDTWLYTEISFSESDYDFAVSQTGYGNTDVLHVNVAIAPSTWAALADAHAFFQIGDNYVADAYFEVAELSITTPDASAVPEPASLALLAIGLAGIGTVRRKKTSRPNFPRSSHI